MNDGIIRVSNRIKQEISDLYNIKNSVSRRWQKALLDDDYLGSVAFDLQSFYQGVERVFEIIAKSIDRSVPDGEKWHKVLLEQMASEISGIRPAVISPETRESLDQFRMFRHVAHNIYSFNIIPERIKGLMDNISMAVDLVCRDFSIFADFLEKSSPFEGK